MKMIAPYFKRFLKAGFEKLPDDIKPGIEKTHRIRIKWSNLPITINAWHLFEYGGGNLYDTDPYSFSGDEVHGKIGYTDLNDMKEKLHMESLTVGNIKKLGWEAIREVAEAHMSGFFKEEQPRL